jgi:hypothetical protein
MVREPVQLWHARDQRRNADFVAADHEFYIIHRRERFFDQAKRGLGSWSLTCRKKFCGRVAFHWTFVAIPPAAV